MTDLIILWLSIRYVVVTGGTVTSSGATFRDIVHARFFTDE